MKISRQFVSLAIGFALVATGAVSLSSCGGDDTLSGPGGSIQAAAAGVAAGVFLNGGKGMNLNLKPTETPNISGLSISGFNAGASLGTSANDPLDACTTVSPTTIVDADGDGIAKEKTYVYDCRDVLSQDGFATTAIGRISITDYDDTKDHMEGGYRYDIEYEGSGVKLPDYDLRYSHRGFFDARKMGASYVYTSQFSAGFSGKERDDNYDVTYRSNYKTVFTPDDSANPWATGKTQFTGFFGIEGKMNGKDYTFNVSWEMGSTELVYDWQTCNYYKSGKMWWIDGAGQRFEITYNCTNFQTTFQGQNVTLE